MWKVVRIVSVMVGLALASGAWAQNYPNRPITIIVPYPAGGGVDMVARSVAAGLETRLGQRVLVENKPGASGLIGARAMAQAAPDGYTLFVCDQGLLTIHPHLYKELGYDPFKDFAPVSVLTQLAMNFVVNAGVPVNSLQEFISLAKSKSEPMTYGSVGQGSVHHLAMERLKQLTGMKLLHIPYKGAAAAVGAVASGEVQAMITGVIVAAPHMQSGLVRVLAVGSNSRQPAVPSVPTFNELGIKDEAGSKGLEVIAWFGLFARSGTDAAIVDRLNKEIREVVAAADIRERFAKLDMEAVTNSPSQFADMIKKEHAVWGRVIRQADLRLDQ